MKKIIVAAVLILSAITLQAQSAKSLYRKYGNEKGVTAVYISPAMFRLIGRLPEVDIEDEDINLKPILKSITGMYILNCENAVVADKLLNDVEKMLDSGKYEMLLEAREEGELTRMFTSGDKKSVNCFILLNIEDYEVNFISFEGEIPREDLENAIAGAAAD